MGGNRRGGAISQVCACGADVAGWRAG